MSRPEKRRRIGLLASLAVLLVGYVGCSVDTPTAPDQVPAPPPTIGGDNWNISVNITPDLLNAGSVDPAAVNITIKSRADGTSPPNGTTMQVSTSLGVFGASDSEATQVGALIDRGKASVLLFAGDVPAVGTVIARLEGSTGRESFEVLGEPVDPFITSVLPSTGPAGGGTSVTIEGLGFREGARVFFGGKLGQVTSVSETRIVVVTPPGDMNTESCDIPNSTDEGIVQVDTPVSVTLEFPDGGSESLDGGFTYLASGGCTAN